MKTHAKPRHAAATATALAEVEDFHDLETDDATEHLADIVVLAPRSEPSGVEMDEDIAAYWGLWSEQIGRALLPELEKLSSTLPAFSSAMICTADGFNLCTIGVDETQVSRLSAMTSSLHSIADAVSGSVHDEAGGPMEMLTLTNGSSKTVVLAIRNLIIGQLLLWVTAGDDSLGIVLMRAKVAAEGIRQVLADE